MHKVFVYGTLRQTKRATHFIRDYALYDLGSFPCIIPKKGAVVRGNVLSIDSRTLREFDYVEGVARGFYTREVVDAVNLPNFKGMDHNGCFVYVAGNVLEYDVSPVIIPSGDWHIATKNRSDVFSPYQ